MGVMQLVAGNPALLAGGGAGLALAGLGLWQGLMAHDPARRRMAALVPGRGRPGGRQAGGAAGAGRVNLRKTADSTPQGLLKSLIPEDRTERVQIQLQLKNAGWRGEQALRNFFLLRLALALAGPVLLLGALGLAQTALLPTALKAPLTGLSPLRLGQIIAVSVALGFYGPGWWLKSRITARRRRIEDGFPNALDLLQISVEAGMGFDAALARVGQELGPICPEIAAEFLTVQQEILAGRDRTRAMADMATRMGIREATSFVNVVAQSIQYGTSLSEALTCYAVEMRVNRELRAQEKANKLPVQMSAVMAFLMLPALFLITLSPIVIRYMDMYKPH